VKEAAIFREYSGEPGFKGFILKLSRVRGNALVGTSSLAYTCGMWLQGRPLRSNGAGGGREVLL